MQLPREHTVTCEYEVDKREDEEAREKRKQKQQGSRLGATQGTGKGKSICHRSDYMTR